MQSENKVISHVWDSAATIGQHELGSVAIGRHFIIPGKVTINFIIESSIQLRDSWRLEESFDSSADDGREAFLLDGSFALYSIP